jgi:bifunctional ADP-heptose synthase (sugar kinase/adenylyltransferase)
VISIAALSFASGMSAAQIGALSNLAGGQVCEKSGVVPVNREQLMEECSQICS